MNEIAIDIVRTTVWGLVVLFLLFSPRHRELREIPGWLFFVWGFCLVFAGMVLDTSDNWPRLNRFVILGDTPYQFFAKNIFGYLLGNIFMAVGTLLWIPGVIERHRRCQAELERAEKEIQVLSRLLPVCANCKKIRDQEGYWNHMEVYLQEHSGMDFTHGICPDCSEKLYPGLGKTTLEP